MSKSAEAIQDDRERGLNPILIRNIRLLLESRKEKHSTSPAGEKVAQHISDFAGSMAFVYLHLIVYGLWITINLGWLGLPKFDPTFVVLAMVASVEAIFISTFVLISQNRMSRASERHADLHLQIGLLAEYEITRVLEIVSATATRLNVPQPDKRELEELKKEVAPEQILERLETESKKQTK